MAPQSPRMNGEDRNPSEWGRMFSSMFNFKRVKRDIGTKFTRVHRCEISNMQIHCIDEGPIGVTIVRNPAILDIVGSSRQVGGYWVKVGSQWLSASTDDDIFVRATAISEAEYGTDLAFGLWPELKSSNRPFRSWARLNRYVLKKWSTLISTLSVCGTSYAVSQADGAINNWFVLGMCLAGVAFVSCTAFIITNDFEW